MVTNTNDVDAARQIGVALRALLLAGVERRAEETDDRHSCPGSGADNHRAGFGIDCVPVITSMPVGAIGRTEART